MTQRQIAQWQEMPYTAHDRRGEVVYHRIMLFVYDHGIDIEHQARGDEDADVPRDWTPVDVYEVRNGRVQKISRADVMRS